ncbi:14874_t:CDS:2, partial [Cetraspora pellucida]
FAENIQLPYSSQQESAIYFKSLYKVAVFGICEDTFPYQIII